MFRQFSVFVILASFFIASCQTQSSPPSVVQAPNVADNSANSKTRDSSAPPANIETTAPQTVSFDAPDGVRIVGTFYGASVENSPAVLMLHQYGDSRAAYKNLARQFQAEGIAVLAIDGRGFGESTKKADGSKVAASQSNAAVNGMKSDVAAAVGFLSAQKNVDRQRVGIVGASYGSSLAIIHAAEHPEIKAVALLSPGTNYFGNLPTEPAVEKYGARPVLIVAAEDDATSAEAARRLDKIAADSQHQLQIYLQGGHGTGIFAAGVGLEKLLLDFFRQNL